MKVKINAQQIIEYETEIELSKEELDNLLLAIDKNTRWELNDILNDYLSEEDIIDWGDFEVTSIRDEDDNEI